jgi:heme exporter protein B
LRELMLPTLIYPMLVPALIGAIQLSRALIVNAPLAENFIWFRILVAFNVIFTILSLALVEIVLVG